MVNSHRASPSHSPDETSLCYAVASHDKFVGVGAGRVVIATMGSLAIDQTFALAMARHGRLGASSSAASLEADTIELILAFVREAHKDLLATRRIVSICARVSSLVNRIEISYSDGTHTAHGGHIGEWHRPLRLQPGEYITSISGQNPSDSSVSRVAFTTNLGHQRTFPAGSGISAPFFLTIGADRELEDLVCTCHPGPLQIGGRLRSIESLVTRETVWTSNMARLLLAHPSTSFAPSPNAPLVHRVGALVQGHDIEVRQCTLEQAKALALELPNCAGFTFNSAAPQFDGVQTVHFKDRRDGNTDWRWQSYLRADWAGADPAPLPYHGTPS